MTRTFSATWRGIFSIGLILGLCQTASAQQFPEWQFNDICVPYELDPEFMRQNGVDPDKILSTFGLDPNSPMSPWREDLDGEGNPVPCDEFHTAKRRIRYEGCHFYDGTPCYFVTTGQMDQNAFTDDAAGRTAFEIAEHFVIYEFVQNTTAQNDGSIGPPTGFDQPFVTDPFCCGFAVGTQVKIFDTTQDYFNQDPLGLWKIGFVRFTDFALSNPDHPSLNELRVRNGINSQGEFNGMPLVFTGDEMFKLVDEGLLSLRYRLGAEDDACIGGGCEEGPRYILCPVHEDPTGGNILPPPTHVEFQPPCDFGEEEDDWVNRNCVGGFRFGATPPAGEDFIYENFDCLQETGDWCQN